jgi:hypothetical protein
VSERQEKKQRRTRWSSGPVRLSSQWPASFSGTVSAAGAGGSATPLPRRLAPQHPYLEEQVRYPGAGYKG